jgi:hypothetical protein
VRGRLESNRDRASRPPIAYSLLATAAIGYSVAAYPLAIRQTTNLTWWRSIVAGRLGFVVFQGVEYVFIR